MADAFPSAEIIGTDIAPTQPSWIPPNVSFQIDDAQLEWTFPENSFDFIHVRYMHGAIDDWHKFYAQMYRALKPGGWFQHIEPNIELRCANPAVPFGDDQSVPSPRSFFPRSFTCTSCLGGPKLTEKVSFANGPASFTTQVTRLAARSASTATS